MSKTEQSKKDLREMYRTRAEGDLPTSISIILKYQDGRTKVFDYSQGLDLKYGTNPSQAAKFYEHQDGSGLLIRKIKDGKGGPSLTNVQDVFLGISISKYHYGYYTCIILKHEMPSGAALGHTLNEAFNNAWYSNPVSNWGGTVVFNSTLDSETANSVIKQFVDVVAAPEIDNEAKKILDQKTDMRVFEISGIENLPKYSGDKPALQFRIIEGTLFVEESPLTAIRTIDDLKSKVVTDAKPTTRQLVSMFEALPVCMYARSNASVFWKNHHLTAIGCGQASRIDTIKQGIAMNRYLNRKARKEKTERTGYGIRGSIVVTDGFFPLPDNIEECARAGVGAILQPGGSKKDGEIIAAADKYGIPMIFGEERWFYH